MLHQLRALFPPLSPAPLLCPGTGHCCHRRQGRQEDDPAVGAGRAGKLFAKVLCILRGAGFALLTVPHEHSFSSLGD